MLPRPSTDGRKILPARGLRTFAYGDLAVVVFRRTFRNVHPPEEIRRNERRSAG